MELKALYELVVEEGVKKDPRGKDMVKAQLAREKNRYEALSDKEKQDYDLQRLTNPYPDTRILYGDPKSEVKAVLVGIDLEGPEILLADRLREKGTRIDLAMTHHPEGVGLTNLYDVMNMQADILVSKGVPMHTAEGILDERILEVRRKMLPSNYFRPVDVARLLDIPYMCCHTAADNHVTTFLQKRFDEEKPDTLQDVIDLLQAIPEYKDVKLHGVGLLVLARSIASESDKRKIRAGNVFVDMTGGTGGSIKAFEKLSETTNIDTIVGMHIGEEHLKFAKENHMNVVVAGHMASDTLGMNLLLDAIEKKEPLEIISCSGFKRYSRIKK